ncbi:hypothetical protein ACOMHN_023613 [Nucella lapillus]
MALNGVLITNSENTYPYRAMLETLLTYGPDAQKCGYLECCLFASDTPGHMDATTGDDNRGLKHRRNASARSQTMDLMGRLHTDLMVQERYLLNGVDVKFRLTPSKNSFCLMEDGANTGCRAEITHCSLFVRKAKINPAIALGHAKALEKGTAKYLMKRVIIKSFTVPLGNVSATQDSLFLSQTPNRIIVALVDSSAVNGVYNKNPFNFQNFDLNFLGITLDGKHVPAKPLTPDFDRKRVTRAYLTTLEGSGLLHKDAAAGFSLDRFSRGYGIFCFDLTPSLVDGEQFELVKSAPLRLELKFAKALPNLVVVLVYGELDRHIEVDKSRQVLTDFADGMAGSESVVAVLLILTAVADHCRSLPVCHLPACYCTNTTNTAHTTGQPDAFHLTCFLQSFSQSDPTLKKLTPQVTSLKLICGDSSTRNYLTPVTFHRLPNLERLGLENCWFARVSSDVLGALPNLRVLEIRQCVFTEIPVDILNTTVKLSRLTLTQSGLHTLPRLCSLRSLRLLNVSGQNLTSVDQSVKDCGPETQFQNLMVLDASNNSLTKLPHVLLNKAPSLRELYIQDNHIRNLSLTGCTQLEVLDMLGQELVEVNLTADGCKLNFKVVKLQGNGTLLSPLDVLQAMSNLTTLHLENMAVGDMIWEVLSSWKDLRHLALPVNRLTLINLTLAMSVHHLNLSTNAITTLHSSTFSSHRRDLTVIDLSGNKVTNLMAGEFVNLTSLTMLDLHDNQLTLVLGRAFRHLPRLRYFRLDRNRLGSLPVYLLREMPALQDLWLDYNSLRSLPFLKNSQHLRLLSAGFNQLTSVPRLSKVPNLEYLLLPGNKVRSVNSPDFLNAPKLGYLELWQNAITSVGRFYNHPGLKWIRMENNSIQDLTFVFRDLPQLRVLAVDRNYLRRLTPVMLPPTLTTLTVTRNLLTYVQPDLFVPMRYLKAVTLAFNGILYRLPWSAVRISPNHLPKPSFVVAPNTFVCDCQMAYLKAWAILKRRGDSNSPLLANMPDFRHLNWLDCDSLSKGVPHIDFEDVPLSDFVCPLTEPLCDDLCTCCDPHSHSMDANCTCIITCPHTCACLHGGSRYVQLYTHVHCDRRNLTRIPDLIPARATHVRLDGNRFDVLRNTLLVHITGAMFLYLNNSGINILEEGCFEGLSVLRSLDLSHNSIVRIDDTTFGSLPALEELHLGYNDIRFLHHAAFSKLNSLRVLSLHGNFLKRVDTLDMFPSTAVLSLAANPWTCDCDFVDIFLKFLLSHRDSVVDYGSLRCFWEDGDSVPPPALDNNLPALDNNPPATNSNPPATNDISLLPSNTASFSNDGQLYYKNQSSILLSEFQFGLYCSNSSIVINPNPSRSAQVSEAMWGAVVGVVVVVVVAVVVAVAGVWWKGEVQACLYVRLGIRVWDKAPEMDRQDNAAVMDDDAAPGPAGADAHAPVKVYDAFVSYSHQDEDFVVNTLVPRLEQQGPRQYRLCVHYRDFPVGECIADTILSSVEKSQRTILILSQHFLDSEWCRFEFRTAHQHVLQQGGHRLVMVLLEDLPHQRLDDDLRMAMKTRTYLTLTDPWFWEKLYFAMPDLPCRPHDNHQQGTPPPLPADHQPPPPPPLPPQPLEEVAVEVGGDSSDTRVDHLLVTLENIARGELAKVHSLAQRETDRSESVEDFKQISDPDTIEMNIPHPDSDRNFHDEDFDNSLMLKQISDNDTIEMNIPHPDSDQNFHDEDFDNSLMLKQVSDTAVKMNISHHSDSDMNFQDENFDKSHAQADFRHQPN